MDPVLRQLNPFHTLISYFFKIHFNIIPLTLMSCMQSLPFRFSNQNFVYISHLAHTCYMSHQILAEEYRIRFLLCSFLCPPPKLSLFLCLSVCLSVSFFLSWRFRYPPQHPVLRHFQSIFFIMWSVDYWKKFFSVIIWTAWNIPCIIFISFISVKIRNSWRLYSWIFGHTLQTAACHK
jgi:hypothetical protein